jgi:opacity protein-like surface antigen
MHWFIRTLEEYPFVIIGSLLMTLAAGDADAQSPPDAINPQQRADRSLEAPASGIWEAGIGEGFGPHAQSLTLSAGATCGIADFGSTQKHDLALASLTYGHMLGCVWLPNTCFRGNWEFRLELFGGAQFSPSTEWLVGLTPHFRYNFATGTRLVPFVDGGAGVMGTGIGEPDLGGRFQFNLQGGAGVQWFIRNNMSITLEARYLHISNADISLPNNGLNGVTGLIGISYYF